jgi:glycosyltransferase involved in cell wall biosynthesis
VHVSVIIPSYRGANKVPHVLEALARQNYTQFEVWVVVDEQDHQSADIARQFNNKLHLNLKVYQNRGRAATRNTGASSVRRGLLIFFDDDTRPEPDCIEKHVSHHQKHSGSIMVGSVPEDIRVMRTDFQHYKAYLSRKWTAPLVQYEGPLPEDLLFLTAANFSIPAVLFHELGGFDERLTDAEDYDLATRASRKHIPMYFNAKAIAWHDDFITCQSYAKRLRQYQEAHQELSRVRPDLYSNDSAKYFNRPPLHKSLVYKMLCRDYCVSLIDKDLEILKYIPVRIRYKLYDIITTGLSIGF